MPQNAAILEALSLFKQPTKLRSIHRRGLPHDMLTLIKIAADDQETTRIWMEASGESTETLKQAAVFYLHHTIAKAGRDKYRTLGLAPKASKEDIRNHKRWLLKWLHPDRNPSKWESALFFRVKAVAQSLEVGGSEPEPASSASASRLLLERNRMLTRRAGRKARLPLRRLLWKDLLARASRRISAAVILGTALWVAYKFFAGDDFPWPIAESF